MKIYKGKESKKKGKYVIIDARGNIKVPGALQVDRDVEYSYQQKLKGIDADQIAKLTMYEDSLNIIKLQDENDTAAVLTVRGMGVSKEIKVSFFEDTFGEKEMVELQKMANVINYVNSHKEISVFDISDLGNQIKEKLSKLSKEIYVNFYTRGGAFTCNASRIQLAIVSAISIAHEISPTRPIDLYINLDNNKLNIKVVIRTDTLKIGRGAREVGSIFPKASSRLELLDNTCEIMNLNYEVTSIQKSVTIEFVATEEKTTALYTRPQLASVIDTIISAFFSCKSEEEQAE